MDETVIRALQQLNKDFYDANCASFSETRGNAWPGWERIEPQLEAGRLLDVACGNLRFERFLEDCRDAETFEFTCVDSCAELVGNQPNAYFVQSDVLESLICDKALLSHEKSASFDSVVCFGFMHHVPTEQLRTRLLQQLLDCARPGGTVALSFWRFMSDERLARKACKTTAHAQVELNLPLEQGDYLLGWQAASDSYRYCHHFKDEEIEELIAGCAHTAELADFFKADGRTGELNAYVVLRRL